MLILLSGSEDPTLHFYYGYPTPQILKLIPCEGCGNGGGAGAGWLFWCEARGEQG